jgi:dipeptidyl-peptidase-4
MKSLLAAALALALTSPHAVGAEPAKAEADHRLTLEVLASGKSLSGAGLSRAQLSPDGGKVSFLRGKPDNKNHHYQR